MDRLSEMEAFVAVVEQGGFTNAAKILGLSKSAISKHVSGLEARLGAQLLSRTTRRVSPTELGLSYYDNALSVLKAAREADDMVMATQSAPKGILRVSAPMDMGTRDLTRVVSEFLRKHPEASIDMTLSDAYVEIIAEGFDIAIRVGNHSDFSERSALRARKLSETPMHFVASREYLEANGTPTNIDDLNSHHLLHYSNLSTGNTWKLLSASGEERHIRVSGRLTVNNGAALLSAAAAGLGVARLPGFIINDAVLAGEVVTILDNLPEMHMDINAIYRADRITQPVLNAFIEYLAACFDDKQSRGDS